MNDTVAPLAPRARGMRDLPPDRMRAFRRVEDAFREAAGRWGYEELRTPTVERYGLFTAAGALTPEMLAGLYTFLDWDGWSGERVVLRYDSTIPVARAAAEAGIAPPARLAYVQSVFRGAEGEEWQCGLEYLGAPAVAGDLEAMAVAATVFGTLDLPVELRLTHAGVARAAIDAAGIDDALARRALLDGATGEGLAAVREALAERPRALAFLDAALDGTGGPAFAANLVALARADLPDAVAPLEELREVAAALVEVGHAVAIDPALPLDFEYYSGVTWEMRGAGETWARGGRYRAAGDGASPGSCGFAIDVDRLVARLGDGPRRVPAVAVAAERGAGLADALRLAAALHRHGIPAALGEAGDAAIRLAAGPDGISVSGPGLSIEGATLDEVAQLVLRRK